MKKNKRILSLIFAALLAFSLTACGSSETAQSTSSVPSAEETAAVTSAEPTASESQAAQTQAAVSEEPAASVEEASAEEETSADETAEEAVDIRFGVLKGPTGIGASYLLDQNAQGLSANHYDVTVLADASDMTAEVAAGQLDIAAIPTNAAAALYAKTNGAIRIAALNTAGVLYILENGDSVQSFEDLRGKTIAATGQGANPEYVLNYLLEQNGLTPGEDVQIEFYDSAELASRMAAGETDLCMLPVPAVTQVLVKNPDVRIALNLSEEWDKLDNGSQLTMGCVVVSTEFAEEHPQAVQNFLKEYETSINWVKDNPEEAGTLCETYEIVGSAAVATKAIPDCNLIFVSGDDIPKVLTGYYQVLYDADPTSIGGSMPDEEFYKLP